jgi:UDP-2-acetamido-3-amino-2,3-dideoxy-glucuronate N-acetyltransferase
MGVRIAQVGLGYWGRNIVRNLADMGVLELVCDEDEGALSEHAPPGVRVTRRFEEVLADPSVQAVVLATPAATHAAMGRAVVESGRDLLVEKPLALNHEEGQDLIRAAAQAGCLVMVGHILEFHPAVEALEALIASGELGELRYLYSNRLNLGRIRTEENILWSFAPHDLAVMIRLAGAEPVRVGSWGGDFLQEGIADVTVTTLEFPGRLRGHVFVSWLHPFKEQRLVVVGDRRMAVFADTDRDKLVIFDKGVDMAEGVPVLRGDPDRVIDLPTVEPLRAELEHFVACVADRTVPRTDGVSGLRVLRVLEAAQASLDGDGLPVTLEGVGA